MSFQLHHKPPATPGLDLKNYKKKANRSKILGLDGQTEDCNPICVCPATGSAFTFTGLLRKVESKIQDILISRQSPHIKHWPVLHYLPQIMRLSVQDETNQALPPV